MYSFTGAVNRVLEDIFQDVSGRTFSLVVIRVHVRFHLHYWMSQNDASLSPVLPVLCRCRAVWQRHSSPVGNLPCVSFAYLGFFAVKPAFKNTYADFLDPCPSCIRNTGAFSSSQYASIHRSPTPSAYLLWHMMHRFCVSQAKAQYPSVAIQFKRL